jgi:hypothetical protein
MRTHVIQTNFTAGEVTPKLGGRVDINRYNNAAEICENVTVVVQGGLRRRDGLKFVYQAKIPGGKVRLIPWVFSREESYVLELGEKYIRIFQNGGIVLTNPNDPNSAPVEVATTITAAMLDQISYAQGADTMFMAHPDTAPMRLVRNSQTNWVFEKLPFTNSPFLEVTPSPDAWIVSSAAAVVGVVVTLKLQKTDETNSGAPTTYTWTQADVGKYVRMNGGIVKLTTFVDGVSIKGELTSLMYSGGDTTPASPNSWTLEETCWSDSLGWPGCVALHQQRLIFAGSKKYPQTVWGSGIRTYLDFQLGYMDDSAYSFTLDSDQINPITAIFSMNALIAMTHSSEFIITGTSGPITPSSVSVRVPSNYGTSYVRPVRVGTELLFTQRAGRKVMAISYDPQSQTAYSVSDLSVLAEHMTETGIVDCAYQQEPEGLLRLVTGVGEMITVTYNKENEVTGWTRNTTGGDEDTFKAVASIPTTTGEDACYCAVERTVSGKTATYIELFTSGLNVDSALVGKIVNGSPAAKDWTALEHLEGKTVQIVADGVPIDDQVVTGGKITLPRPASMVHIGLQFISRVKTLKPEFQSPIGTPQGARVSTVSALIRVLDTIGLSINGEQIPFRKYGTKVLDHATGKFTGDVPWTLNGWDNNELLIEQTQPLPFHLLAIIRTIAAN